MIERTSCAIRKPSTTARLSRKAKPGIVIPVGGNDMSQGMSVQIAGGLQGGESCGLPEVLLVVGDDSVSGDRPAPYSI